MIVVAIIAILAAIALPSYQQQIIKSNRAAAKGQMLDIANREQQYLFANRVYATKALLETGGYALPTEVSARYSYDVTVGTDTVPSFQITFTPIGAQATDGAITLDSQGVKSPASKW